MHFGEGVLYVLILACEAAFWIVLGAALACRYLLRWQRTSFVLLWCVPLIDLALLALTTLDLRSGSTATFGHGLATAYIAFTVAFGALVIRWADGWFSHRFANGPRPERSQRGWAGVRHELKLWGRCLIAVSIMYVLLSAMIVLVDDSARTQPLERWFRLPLGTAFFWFVFGPLWQLIFFQRDTSILKPERREA